jgi:hypothetical protein
LLGRRYNRTKKAAHRPEKELAQNDLVNPLNTAAKLAVEHGVSEATVADSLNLALRCSGKLGGSI